MAGNSKESEAKMMNVIKGGEEAEASHLLKSIPLKLFKAKDVQDHNFKSGIPG